MIIVYNFFFFNNYLISGGWDNLAKRAEARVNRVGGRQIIGWTSPMGSVSLFDDDDDDDSYRFQV